jgi:hypothetical protein
MARHRILAFFCWQENLIKSRAEMLETPAQNVFELKDLQASPGTAILCSVHYACTLFDFATSK